MATRKHPSQELLEKQLAEREVSSLEDMLMQYFKDKQDKDQPVRDEDTQETPQSDFVQGAVEFRWVKRKILNITSLMLVGYSREEATKQAKKDNKYYYGDWMQYSLDGGETWYFTPPAKEIPRLPLKFES